MLPTSLPTTRQTWPRLRKLLAEAGYPNGEGYPTIEYSCNDAGYHVPLAEYLQQAWGDLGITLTISKMEWSSFTAARRAGEYDVARNGWVMDYNDPSNMLDLFCTSNGNNDGKYANPDFDAAIDASRVADSAEHFAQLHKAEDILMEDMAACRSLTTTTTGCRAHSEGHLAQPLRLLVPAVRLHRGLIAPVRRTA